MYVIFVVTLLYNNVAKRFSQTTSQLFICLFIWIFLVFFCIFSSLYFCSSFAIKQKEQFKKKRRLKVSPILHFVVIFKSFFSCTFSFQLLLALKRNFMHSFTLFYDSHSTIFISPRKTFFPFMSIPVRNVRNISIFFWANTWHFWENEYMCT